MVPRSKKSKKENPAQVQYSLRTRGTNICRNQRTNDKVYKTQIDVLARQELNKSHNKDSWKELSLLSEENFNDVDSPEGSSLPLSKRINTSGKKWKRKPGLFSMNLSQRRQHLLKEVDKSYRQRQRLTSESECYDGSKHGSENMNVVNKSSKHCWKINCGDTSVKNNVTDKASSDELYSDELIIDEDIVPASPDKCDVNHTPPEIDNTLFKISEEIVTKNKAVKYLNESLDETECASNKTASQGDLNEETKGLEMQDCNTSNLGSDDLYSASNNEKELSSQSGHKSDSSINYEHKLKISCFKTRKKQNCNTLIEESTPEKVCSNISLEIDDESPRTYNNSHLSEGPSAEKSKIIRDLFLTNSKTSPAISIQSPLHEHISDFDESLKKLTDLDEESSSGRCSGYKESSPNKLSPILVKMSTNESLGEASDNTSEVPFDCGKVAVDDLVNHSQGAMVTLENNKLCETSFEKISFEESAERNLSPTKADMTNEPNISNEKRSLSPRKADMTNEVDISNEAPTKRRLRPRIVSMTNEASVKKNLSPRNASIEASVERNLSPAKADMSNGASVVINLSPAKADMSNEASAQSRNPTLDQSLPNHDEGCKKLSFDAETSLKVNDTTNVDSLSNCHSSLNNMSITSEISSQTNKSILDGSLSNTNSTFGNISKCFEISQNNITDESNTHDRSPAKSVVQGNAQKTDSPLQNVDDQNSRISPVHLEASKISDHTPKYNLRKRQVYSGSKSFRSLKSPKTPINTHKSSEEKRKVTSQSSCSPRNSQVIHLKKRKRDSGDSSVSNEPPVKRKIFKESDDENSFSQCDIENSSKRNKTSSRESSRSRRSSGQNHSVMDESNMNCENSDTETKNPDLIVTIGEHKINITEIVNKAFAKWRLPLKVLKKVQAIDTELVWNRERMFKNITNPKQSKNTEKKPVLEEDMKLMYRRWSEFCRLYNFNKKKPRYFFNTPIVSQYFSSNFLKYFTTFISQDLAHCLTQRTILRNFQYLFEDDDDVCHVYSDYDDAVVLALHKSLSGHVSYINHIVAFALGKSYLSVTKRHLKIRSKSTGNLSKSNSPKSRKSSRIKGVNESKSGSEKFNSDDETTSNTPKIQITKERLDHLKNKSEMLFRLFDAMLEISGNSRASAHKIIEKDLSVKDWKRIGVKIGNIPAHVAKALFQIKVHPLLTSTQATNKYQLIYDILHHLNKHNYKCWEDVEWSDVSRSLNKLKPLFIFTTFAEFVRIQVPEQHQGKYKDCMNYLLKEKLDFIQQKIKDKIILDVPCK